MYPASRAASAKPVAIARAWRPVNFTGAYFSADFALRRRARSWGRRANDRRSFVFVAAPKRNSSQHRTKSDHDPRGSLGNQKPCAEKMMWYARTGIRRSFNPKTNAPQAVPLTENASTHERTKGAPS